MTCETGHEKVTPDFFARDLRVRRAVPGDCYCHACNSPVAYYWNSGRPIPANEGKAGDLGDKLAKATMKRATAG